MPKRTRIEEQHSQAGTGSKQLHKRAKKGKQAAQPRGHRKESEQRAQVATGRGMGCAFKLSGHGKGREQRSQAATGREAGRAPKWSREGEQAALPSRHGKGNREHAQAGKKRVMTYALKRGIGWSKKVK